MARLNLLFTANATQARTELKSVKYELATMNATMVALSATGSNLMTSFKGFARMIGLAFGAVTLASGAAIMGMTTFNENLTRAAAIANITTSEMNMLGKSITQMSIKYGQSANVISLGTVELTKAGLSMDEIAMSMDVITQTMLANSISFDEAAKIGIYAVKQFGGDQGFGAMPELMDKIQKVTQATIMDFGDMQQALQYAGSSALLAKVPFEQLLAVMGTLSQRAMESGIASRSVNQMMLNLIRSQDEMQAWADSMGLAVEVIKDGVLNLDGLIRAFSTLDFGIEDVKKSMDVFTVRAMRSWGLLITGADEYVKLLDEDLPNAQGTLGQVTQRQTESIAFQIGRIKSIFMAPLQSPEFMKEGVKLIKALEGPLTKITKLLYTGILTFLKWTTENSDELLSFIEEMMNFFMDMVTPLYNIAETMLSLGKHFVDFIMYIKILQTLGYHNYLRTTGTLMMANLQIGAQTETLRAVRMNSSKRELAINQLKIQSNINLGMSYMNVAASMLAAAGAAYIMGKAMGWDNTTAAMMGLTGAMGGMMGGMMIGSMINPGLGTAIGGGAGFLIGGGLALGSYYAGTTQHKEMERPDFSVLESSLARVDFSAPSYGDGGGGSSTTTNNYNVNFNASGSIIADEQRLSGIVINAMNNQMEGQ